jgi:cell shape-determining protein MreD
MFKSNLAILLIYWFLLILCSVLFCIIQPGEWKPNLLLIFTVYIAFFRDLFKGSLMVLFLSLFTDFFSYAPAGFYTFSMVCTFMLLIVISNRYFWGGNLFRVIITLIATVASQMLLFLVTLMFVNIGELRGVVLKLSIPQIFSTAAVSPLIYQILGWIDSKLSIPVVARSRRTVTDSLV